MLCFPNSRCSQAGLENACRSAVQSSLRFWAMTSSARPALRDPPWQPLCPAEVQTRRQTHVAALESQ